MHTTLVLNLVANMGERYDMGNYTTVVYMKNHEVVTRSFKNHYKAWKFAFRLSKKGRKILDAY